MSDDSQSVLVERRDDVAVVTLNRPQKLNALHEAGWRRLAEVMGETDADEQVRCVVLRGAGKAFGAGADIAEFETVRRDAARAQAYGEIEMAGVVAVARCRHPTVAMIGGACVGGGLEIALACDLRVAGESSRFGMPINRLGLTTSYDEMLLLVRTIGPGAIRELLLEGQVVDAARAYHLQLVTHLVPDDAVEAETMAVARRIADGAPLVNRWHKAFLRRLEDPAPLTEAERREGFAAFDTEDFRAGYRAFLAGERPRFEGR